MDVNGILKKGTACPAQIYKRTAAGNNLIQLRLKIVITLKDGHDLVQNLVDRTAESTDMGSRAANILTGRVAKGVRREALTHSLRNQVQCVRTQSSLAAVDLTAAQAGGISGCFQRKIPEHFIQRIGHHLDAQQHGAVIGVEICVHSLPPVEDWKNRLYSILENEEKQERQIKKIRNLRKLSYSI